MLANLSKWLEKNAKGGLILFLLALFFLFNLVVMPSGKNLMGGPAHEVGSIDLTFGASPASLLDRVEAYGPQGRAVYRIFTLTADVAYPIIYSLFMGLAITYTFRRIFPEKSWLQKLNLVPFGALLFDILENIGIASLMTAYPQRLTLLAGYTVVMNFIKWILAGASTLLVVIGFTGWLVVSIKDRLKVR